MTSVTTRASGPSGETVSTLALGSWHTWDRADFDEVVRTLRIAVDAGVALFDVGIYNADPDAPSEGATDIIFANAVKVAGIARDQYKLAVKAWLPVPASAPAGLTRQVEVILARQGADHAEYLVLGDLMTDIDDFSHLLDEIASLIQSGKIAHWCVNNWSAEQVARVREQALERGVPSLEYVQHKYGFTRRSVPEGEPFTRLCEQTGITIQASDTFEGGLIFDTETSRMIGGDIGGTQRRIRESRARFKEAAESLGASVAALAVAFPLTHPHTSSALIGSRTPEQTLDNLGAFALLERYSASDIRAACEEFWFDRDTVDPAAGWGTRPGDDPAGYVPETR